VPDAERPVLLVLRALGLGDLLTALPALRALRDAHPRHEIVLACPGALRPLALLSGAVDRVVDTAPVRPAPTGPVDLAVNLHGRGPQSHRLLLNARPRRLLAFAHDDVPESRGMPRWDEQEHEVQRWCRLVAEGLGVVADPSPLDLPVPRAGAPPIAHGATLIHPGAAFASRRWPAERWAAVARPETARGRTVVITGDASEVGLARAVAQMAGLDPAHVLAGATGLIQLCALVAASARVICGDTGVAHLATALRRPSVVLFGPTPPECWGPPSRPIHRVLWAGTTGDPWGDAPDPGLLRIGVDDVLAALRSLPDGYADSSSRSARSSSDGTARRSRSTQGSPRVASKSAPQAVARW
jgi:ADP-heptose:LPS heptosyltransferase